MTINVTAHFNLFLIVGASYIVKQLKYFSIRFKFKPFSLLYKFLAFLTPFGPPPLILSFLRGNSMVNCSAGFWLPKLISLRLITARRRSQLDYYIIFLTNSCFIKRIAILVGRPVFGALCGLTIFGKCKIYKPENWYILSIFTYSIKFKWTKIEKFILVKKKMDTFC